MRDRDRDAPVRAHLRSARPTTLVPRRVAGPGMAGKNLEVARLFELMADLLEIRGDNPFRIRAYRRAAQSIEGTGEDIEAVGREKRLSEIPGIGKDLADKIEEYFRTGRMKDIDALQQEIPRGVVELMNVPGVGPKTAKLLYDKAGVRDVSALEELAKRDGCAGSRGSRRRRRPTSSRPSGHQEGQERMPLVRALPWPTRSPGPRATPGRRAAEPGRVDPPPEGDGGRLRHPGDLLETRRGHGHAFTPSPGRSRCSGAARPSPPSGTATASRSICAWSSPTRSAPRSCTSPARSSTTSGSARWP